MEATSFFKPHIVVLGSCNTDMVVKANRLPVPGETVLGGTFYMNPGGKGANQAIAASRLGADVTFISKIGYDLFGLQALEIYKSEKINTEFIFTDQKSPSGVAVDSFEENSIIVAPGASRSLSPEDIDKAEEKIKEADILLMQLEVPIPTAEYAAAMAFKYGKKVILNPAPASTLSDSFLKYVHTILPNRIEAEMLSGIKVTDLESARRAATAIGEKGIENVVVTLGKGANQAVAAARLGGAVTFVSSLGNDLYAGILKKQFEKEGIVTDYIMDDLDHPTGTALLFVANSGENCIAVAPGANYSLLAGRKGKKVLFNPAPACRIDEELMRAIDILVVNELEAAFISGIRYTEDNLEEIGRALKEAGARNVVTTLGSRGVYLKNERETVRLPACKVDVMDTTAAGDTFCGALAVVCARREIEREALNFANAAAALAVMRLGAQPSIPTLDEVKNFMLENELDLSFNF